MGAKKDLSERQAAAVGVYASQLDIHEDRVVGALTELFGARMADEALWAMGGGAWDATLSRRERSIAVVSALIAQGCVKDRLRAHVNWASRNGLSRQELDSLVSMLGIYVGYPRAAEGMAVLIDELGTLPEEAEPDDTAESE